MIKKGSPVPIYFQLEQGIKELIETKQLMPGDMIPSEREYADKYQISRMTVRQAINNLVKDGYLQRERGKGTYVALKKVEQNLTGLTGFSEDMRKRGMEPGTKVIDFSIIKADATISEKLRITEGSLVYQVKRLRLADQLPMAYELLYMSRELVPGLTKEITEESIYQYVEDEIGLRIVSGVQELEAIIAQKEEAEALDIKIGAPVLYFQQTSVIENGTPLEFVKSYYRADRYKFRVEIVR